MLYVHKKYLAVVTKYTLKFYITAITQEKIGVLQLISLTYDIKYPNKFNTV